MYVRSISFLVYQPFELEGVMAVSKGAKTHSSQKTVLPVDADRTMVVLATTRKRAIDEIDTNGALYMWCAITKY